jgi:cbb3-type cytochrome oxidase subunit 1
MIFGVVYWMFPKLNRNTPHDHEGLWLATFWCFNIGLVFRVIGEPLHLLRPEAL